MARASQAYATPLFKSMVYNCISQDLSWAQPAKKVSLEPPHIHIRTRLFLSFAIATLAERNAWLDAKACASACLGDHCEFGVVN